MIVLRSTLNFPFLTRNIHGSGEKTEQRHRDKTKRKETLQLGSRVRGVQMYPVGISSH